MSRPEGHQPAQVLVVGEALMDLVRTADGEARAHPGGSPANVAVGLSRLGVPTELLTALGADAHGDLLRSHLAAAGVSVRPTAPTRATATAEAHLAADGSAGYRFAIDWVPGPFAAGPGRVLHTGSLAMVVEPGASQVLAALETARPGTVISLDPNVRPGLGLPREQVRVQFESFAARAHLVKLSDEDLSWVYPGTTLEEVAARLHRLGVRLVVVTRGAAGCALSGPGWRSDLPAPTAAVVDTIGAGDSFMAGLLFALLAADGERELRAGTVSRQQAEAWARTAMRCAAITVGRTGAQPPCADELPREAQSETISSVPANTSPEAMSTIVV